ncbi:hypothetical protein E2542_SST16724 [Spatholobus suberectus]|nr:hypothetical protein E2542_SST16724 [Spatholobus suberectus]
MLVKIYRCVYISTLHLIMAPSKIWTPSLLLKDSQAGSGRVIFAPLKDCNFGLSLLKESLDLVTPSIFTFSQFCSPRLLVKEFTGPGLELLLFGLLFPTVPKTVTVKHFSPKLELLLFDLLFSIVLKPEQAVRATVKR